MAKRGRTSSTLTNRRTPRVQGGHHRKPPRPRKNVYREKRVGSAISRG